jgi:FkbM family methyltransferase
MAEANVDVESLDLATARVGGREFTLAIYAESDAVSAGIKTFHVWHPAISLFLTYFLRPGDCFVDVGAHIGYFSALAGTLVGPKGRVIAFEPDRRNFARLERNLGNCEAVVTAKCAAIAEATGQVRFLRHPREPGHHRLIATDSPNAITVPAMSLSEALADAGPVRCIKIDVQGAERAVLAGAKNLLRKQPAGGQPFIIVEIAPAAWLKHDPDLAWLKSFLEDHSYDAHLFLEAESLKVAPPRLGWNALAAVIQDIAAFNHPSKELDLLLAPSGYWSWLLKRYAGQTPEADR